jgi:hypothetical protein
MQEHDVRELLERLYQAMDPALEYQARHEDFTVEMPQSGERTDREGLRTLQEHFPDGPPKVTLRRVTGGDNLWFVETEIHYADGKVFFGAKIVEFRDGKILRETRYYGEPFEAPAWRAQWVQRIDEPVAS